MDRPTSVATFVKIAGAGCFAGGGRKLGISPSTVTTIFKISKTGSACVRSTAVRAK